MKILFVCTGNTCRSPMAQVMAAQLLGEAVTVASAGLMAIPNAPASAHSVSVMNERGLDLNSHISQKVTDELLNDSDIVLTMTSSHKAALAQSARDKVWTLGEYAASDKTASVSDPFGGDLNVYRACADEIYALLLKLKDKISGRPADAASKTVSNGDEADLHGNLHVTMHPLVESKLTMLRDKNTGNKEFRELVREIAMFICYEATRDAPLSEIDIETPVSKTKARITNRKYAIVPILRAGLGMVDGVSGLLPTAKIGHIGFFRDPESLKPVEYYGKLPPDAHEREILLLDPMVGTGGTAAASIDFLKKNNVSRIKLLSLLVSPEGAERLMQVHPDVRIYTAARDERLDVHGYIVPGLGDAGDRLFGTK